MESVKVESVTTIMRGTIDLKALLAKAKEEKRKWLEENRSRLKEEYEVTENFSDDELLKIRDYEIGESVCEKCHGLPCKKSKNKSLKQVVEIDVPNGLVYEKVGTCKYEKARQRMEQMKHNFRSARISANYLDKTFADYEVDENNRAAVEVAKKIIKGEEHGAYFYGAFGAGKTFLSALIAKEMVSKGISVLFYKVPFLVKDLQDAMFDKSNPFKESELLKQICEVPVLILDDFGMSGKVTTYAAGRLSMIIDARYENENLTTIITSNLSLRRLEEKLDKPSDTEDAFTLDGGRIVDRLREMCKAVKFEGESRRGKNG